MRGSTRKRGKTWTAYFDGPADLETGARKQKTKGGFATRKAAQQFLADVVTQLGQGTFTEPSKTRLGRFMRDEWLPAVSGQLRPLSATKYAQIVRTHIAGRDIGSVPLCQLSPGHLNALYAELERDELSASTRRHVHAVISRALADAVRWGKVGRNVAKMADPPSLPRSRVQAWTAGELRRFLDHVQDDRLSALWRVAATTGMRRGELAGLTWRALDTDGARLRVDQQLVPSPGECPVCGEQHSVSFGPPKSRRSERTVALDAVTIEALNAHREVQVLERDLAGPVYDDHDLVFADEIGQPIHPQRLTEWFTQLRKAAKIPTGSLHVLRHTAITLMLTSGIPLHVVAARVGDDPKTILGTYAHLLPTSDAMAAEVVAAHLVDKPLTNPAANDAVEPKTAP
jgi:integrase